MDKGEKIVEVEWQDITGHDEVPSGVKDFEGMLATCKDYGALLYENKKIIVLAHHTTHIPSHDEDLCETQNDIIIIPRSVVKNIKSLSGDEK